MNGWYGGILKVATLVPVVFALGACDSGNIGGASDAKATRTAAPVSPEVYRETLAAVTAPLNKALTEFGGARSINELSARISRLEGAAGQGAVRLGQQSPPPAMAAEHAKLVGALRQFDEELKALGEDVDGREICTASSARARLGQSEATSALRAAAAALTAKVPDDKLLALALPGAAKLTTQRPPNGHFVRSGRRGGRGTPTIDKGGDSHAVITPPQGRPPAASVYVRKDKKYTVSGIGDGSYKVYFTSGVDWDRKARRFARKCAFQQFDEKMAFRTTRTATEIRWSTWEISLQPVSGGTARTSDVEPGNYPGT